MPTQQTWYLRDSTPSGLTLPSGALGGWALINSAKFGANAREASASSGSANTDSAAGSYSGHTTEGQAQFCTGPLAAQTINAGNWTVGWANWANAAFAYTGQVGIYLVNGSTGAVRSTIFARGNVGASRYQSSAAKTSYSASLSGGSVTVTDGDYIVVEIGSTHSFASLTVTARYGNSTAISSDAATNTSPKSFFTAPAAITLQTPAQNISATAQDFSGSLGSPSINQDISTAGVATAEGIGSASVTLQYPSQDVSLTGVASVLAFGSPTVAPDQAINPTGADWGALGTPSLTQDIQATSLDSDATVAQPSLTQDISATGIATAEGIGQPTVTAASPPQDITLSAGTDWADVGTPGIEQVISTSGQDWSELGEPAVDYVPPAEIVLSGIPTDGGMGTPSVSQDAQAAGIGSDLVIGNLTVTTYNEIQAEGLPSQVALGVPISILPEQTITLDGTDWGAVGTPLVANEQDITLNAGAAWGALGTPQVAPDQDITLDAGADWSGLGEPAVDQDTIHAYGEVWGLFDGTGTSVVPGPVDITCTGNDFAGEVGTPGEVSPGPVNISLTGVDFSGMNTPQGPFGWVVIYAAAYGEPASEFLKRLRLGLGIGL